MTATFKRYEYKYRLNIKQFAVLQEIMKYHIKIDEYGRNIINNIYFDTPDFF